LNQKKGPLPLTASFNAPSDAPSCLIISGSVWTQTPNQTIGIAVSLDGQPVGSASLFSNLQATHRAVVPTYIPVKLKFGAHTLVLSATPGATVSDLNDYFSVVLEY
jgi:hypothetical protein